MVSGEGGNDLMFGGAGNDTMTGDGGSNFLEGGDGVDSLYAGSDNDWVSGGKGMAIASGVMPGTTRSSSGAVTAKIR